MSKRRKKCIIIPGPGDPCPRCDRPTQIREHTFVSEKHLRQPFYYSRWFYCTNKHCRTGPVMPARFKVMRDDQEVWDH